MVMSGYFKSEEEPWQVARDKRYLYCWPYYGWQWPSLSRFLIKTFRNMKVSSTSRCHHSQSDEKLPYWRILPLILKQVPMIKSLLKSFWENLMKLGLRKLLADRVSLWDELKWTAYFDKEIDETEKLYLMRKSYQSNFMVVAIATAILSAVSTT